MKAIVGKFFTSIRQKLFAARVEREIHFKIFPHLNQESDHGYPFDSNDGLVRLHIRNNLQAAFNLDLIERAAAHMPRAYGDAFRYIAYCDLNQRMEMYLELAERHIESAACDPRCVATHA